MLLFRRKISSCNLNQISANLFVVELFGSRTDKGTFPDAGALLSVDFAHLVALS
jgi:hypothetical protein